MDDAHRRCDGGPPKALQIDSCIVDTLRGFGDGGQHTRASSCPSSLLYLDSMNYGVSGFQSPVVSPLHRMASTLHPQLLLPTESSLPSPGHGPGPLLLLAGFTSPGVTRQSLIDTRQPSWPIGAIEEKEIYPGTNFCKLGSPACRHARSCLAA
ncbi:hypothetical protein LX36DRAFT_324297 [Colletotrichum falcatum]|nr:hypothetical protein LX36DRAFT_324297 [Colletotrichum falcatum]